MSDYNLRIHTLQFNCEDNFTLKVIITGENFPKPDSTQGVLDGNEIIFNLTSSGETTNSETFTFSDPGIEQEYTFKFIDGGGEAINGMYGSITTKGIESNLFSVGDCEFIEQNGEVSFKDSDTAEPQTDKKGNLTLKKKPSITKMFECVDISLNSTKTAIVMTLKEAEKDKLFGEIENIPSTYFAEGIGINTILIDDNPEPINISEVAIVNN